MDTLPIRRKMEEGRTRTGGRGDAFKKVRVSQFVSTRLKSGVLLLLLCGWTCASADDVVISDNATDTATGVISRTLKCSDPKTTEGKLTVSCEGYSTIPTGLGEDIHVLDMSKGNALQTLKSGDLSRANLPALSKLLLVDCRIKTIERGALEGGQGIQILDLSNNRIEVLDPEVFAGLETLTYLHLKGNPINRFQPGSVFPNLPRMTTLDLSNCELDKIPEGVFDNLRKLEKIFLNNNKLQTLSWKVFKNVTNILHTLELQGNKWHCDCNIKFLLDLLKERGIPNWQTPNCASSPEYEPGKYLIGESWSSLKDDNLICSPKIHKFNLESHDVLPPSGSPGQQQTSLNQQTDGSDKGKVQLGQDVYFECEYSGFPRPEVTWLKNESPIALQKTSMVITDITKKDKVEQDPSSPKQETQENEINAEIQSLPLSSNQQIVERQPKIEVQNGNSHMELMSDVEKQRNYHFKEHLIVRRVQAEDRGVYVCLVIGVGGKTDEKGKLLNMTVLLDDGLYLGGIGGKKGVAVWLWILLAILCVLILVLMILLICLIWRKKEKKKQEGFRKVIHEKFKDSNVDLGELLDTKPPPNANTNLQNQANDAKLPDGSTPLLDGHTEHSTILISDHFPPQRASTHLPDVALGNGELVRNSAIFSPKTPLAYNGHITPADARKEFFARQISEPYLRPASAMSITRPQQLDAAQKRYVFANMHQNQSEPIPGVHGEPPYAIPAQIRTLPRSGSALSMSAIPEHDLRRQMLMRQNYQPIYGTTARIPPHRRNPSISSEPPHELAAFTYSTLPRRVNRQQFWSRPVSPTNSTCSNYSTLSWRPNINPVTGVMGDGIGPRRGADGGSTLSLNKTPDSLTESNSNLSRTGGDGIDSMNRAMMMTPVQINGGGKVKSLPRSQRLAHSRTPNSLTRGHNDFFSFEPIQEVEGSENASSFTLDKTGGRQTPQGLYTQSLARGEPRYKKKKPPPIAVFPSNLKEPSRAFDHLKGKSATAENTKPIQNLDNPDSVIPASPRKEPIIVEDLSIRKNMSLKNRLNGVSDNVAPVLDSPIDEIIHPAPGEVPTSQFSKSGKLPPPLPPPKPKRSQEALDKGSQDNIDDTEGSKRGIGDNIERDSCGTVV